MEGQSLHRLYAHTASPQFLIRLGIDMLESSRSSSTTLSLSDGSDGEGLEELEAERKAQRPGEENLRGSRREGPQVDRQEDRQGDPREDPEVAYGDPRKNPHEDLRKERQGGPQGSEKDQEHVLPKASPSPSPSPSPSRESAPKNRPVLTEQYLQSLQAESLFRSALTPGSLVNRTIARAYRGGEEKGPGAFTHASKVHWISRERPDTETRTKPLKQATKNSHKTRKMTRGSFNTHRYSDSDSDSSESSDDDEDGECMPLGGPRQAIQFSRRMPVPRIRPEMRAQFLENVASDQRHIAELVLAGMDEVITIQNGGESESLDDIISRILEETGNYGAAEAASKEQRDEIPTVAITKQQVESGVQCCVCMESFAEGDAARQLPCRHCFHNACIMLWLMERGICPYCREPIAPKQETTEEAESTTPSQSGSENTCTSPDPVNKDATSDLPDP